MKNTKTHVRRKGKMRNKIKLGVVGLGRIGMHMANREISNFPELYEIVAVCDLIEDRANKLGEQTGAKTYTDYAEMLKQEDIEMVYVATRSCDHFEHAMMALKAGKDVVLEKPATVSYEEAVELYNEKYNETDHITVPVTADRDMIREVLAK